MPCGHIIEIICTQATEPKTLIDRIEQSCEAIKPSIHARSISCEISAQEPNPVGRYWIACSALEQRRSNSPYERVSGDQFAAARCSYSMPLIVFAYRAELAATRITPVHSGETIAKSVVNTRPTSANCTDMRIAATSRLR